MNWNNYALISIIITIVLATTIEARGGKVGGGRRSSGSRSSGSGGGGFWGSLFGGSSSSSKTTSSHVSPSQQPSYNPYYQRTGDSFGSSPSKSSGSSQSQSSLLNWKPFHHTYNQPTLNYGNNFGSNRPKATDSTDYLTGYMMGRLLSNTHKVFESFDSDYIHPRLSVLANNEPESTTKATIPTNIETNMSEWSNIYKELNEAYDLNSPQSYFDRLSKIDFSKLFLSTLRSINGMPTSSTELPIFTTESSTMISELTSAIPQKQPTADKKDNVVDPHKSIPSNDELLISPMTSSAEIVPATTESTQEGSLDVTTPYGLICSPITYNEVNEFGVNVVIERLACYPALEPVASLE